MSQNLLLCYGMIKDQLSTENRVFSEANPFCFRTITPFIREEFRREVLEALNKTGNSQLQTRQITLQPILRQLIFELTSSIFLRLLEAATNQDNLLPDPYLTEGGFLQEANAIENVHFPVDKLHRVVRLDIAVGDLSADPGSIKTGINNEVIELASGDCLLSNCSCDGDNVDTVSLKTENGKFLTLYYYQNPNEPEINE